MLIGKLLMITKILTLCVTVVEWKINLNLIAFFTKRKEEKFCETKTWSCLTRWKIFVSLETRKFNERKFLGFQFSPSYPPHKSHHAQNFVISLRQIFSFGISFSIQYSQLRDERRICTWKFTRRKMIETKTESINLRFTHPSNRK